MIETQRRRDTEGNVDNRLSYKVIGAVHIRDPLLIDILVEDRLVVEVKATEKDHPIHQVQLLTYLRLKGLRLGLVINFGSQHVKGGIKRVING